MQLDIWHVNIPVSDALQEFTKRRVERVLRPFLGSIGRVDVRVEDVNGPRGGVDMRCTVSAELATSKPKVVVKAKSSDAYSAVQAACGRLGEAVSRRLTRRRRLDRSSAPPPRAAPSGEAPGSTPEPVPAESHLQVTATDHQRLRSLVHAWSSTRDREAAEALADELDRAEVVPQHQIAGNVVTMNSRVVFGDDETGESREVSLVYPAQSDPEHGRVSVLAPIGSALLGLSVGQTIDWPLPRGRTKRLRIVRIVYQPEEAGHLHL